MEMTLGKSTFDVCFGARPDWVGLLRCASSPCVSRPDGLPSLARARRRHPRLGRTWRRRTAAHGALPVRSRGAIKAAPSSRELNIRVRQAAPQAWERPVPMPGDRALSSFTLRVNERA